MVSLVSILNDNNYNRVDINIIYRPRLTYNMLVVYLLFCRTFVNIENPPTGTWIWLNCIKIKSIKIE